MDMKRQRSPMDGPPIAALFYLLLLTQRCALAQSPPPDSNNNNNNYYSYGKFSPTMAIVIVVMISFFFFLGFFSIYIRSCGRGDGEFSASFRFRGIASAARSRRQQGLSPEVIETFPTMVYVEVKGLRADKGTLECAVCLSEFDDDEELRLLPHCNHVFHPDCIGAWLASHVTCPVCRANLAQQATTTADLAPPPDAEGPSQDHVAIVVDTPATHSEEDAIELARIGSQRRAARSRSGRRPMKFPRSHSTGHSLVCPVEDVDRYTLRLPEQVRREILSARKLHRWASCVAVTNAEDASSRHGPRGDGDEREGNGRLWRSFRFGKSDRWPSSFFRTLSFKIPAWAAGRKAEGESEGSVKKEEGDGPTSGKEAVVRERMERLENESAAAAGKMESPDATTS